MKTPAPVCHQGLAGIAMVVRPSPTSVVRMPVMRMTGGSGTLRSIIARSHSIPDIDRPLSSIRDPLGLCLRTRGIGASISLPG
jgi:hypothetical protein